jgi:uncharacterized protein YoaH (UPF0181 family)
MGTQFCALDIDKLASASSKAIVEAITGVLSNGISNGEGLDGRALEIIQDVLNSDGGLFSDGECLDIVGRVIDIWRAIEL